MSVQTKNIKLLNHHIFLFGLADQSFWAIIITFLMSHGLPLWHVFLYCLLWNGFYTALIVFGVNWSTRYGFTKSALLGISFYAALIFSFWHPLFSSGLANIVLYSVLAALFIVFYWPARHILYSESIHPETAGVQVAQMNIWKILSDASGIFLFAMLHALVGTAGSHLFVLLLLIASVIPLLRLSLSTSSKKDVNWKEVWQHQKKPAVQQYRLPYFSEGVYLIIADLVVLLIIFYKFGGLTSFGIVQILSALITTLLLYITGCSFDAGQRKTLSKHATNALQFSTFLQATIPFLLSYWYIITANALARFSREVSQGILNASWYQQSHAHCPRLNILLREIYLNLGRIIGALIGLIVTMQWELQYDFLLILLAILPLHFLRRFGVLGENSSFHP